MKFYKLEIWILNVTPSFIVEFHIYTWRFAELYFYELYCKTNWYQGLHENTGQFSVSKLVSLHCMYVHSMLGLKYKGELSDSEHGMVVVARQATLNIPETTDLLTSSHTVVSSVYRKLHYKMSLAKARNEEKNVLVLEVF